MANVTSGKVISNDEGIVTVSGLSSVGAGELINIKIGDNKYARALDVYKRQLDYKWV